MRTLRSRAQVLALAGLCLTSVGWSYDLEQARALYGAGDIDGALAVWRGVTLAAGASAADVATARNNSCAVLSDRGELELALADCTEALSLREGLGDSRRIARTLNNLGLVQQRRGALDQAQRHFEAALALNEETADAEGVVVNLLNLAIVAGDAARYREALDLVATARERASLELGAPWAAAQLAIADLNHGALLDKLGAHREALDLYRSLLAGDSPLGDNLGPAGRATLLLNSGVMERNLGDPVRARANFEEAARLFAELDDRAGRANALLNLAVVVDLDLDESGADGAYAAAHAAAERGQEPGIAALTLVMWGDRARRSGDFVRARELAEAALDHGEALPELHWTAHALLGRIALAQGRSAEALADFEESISIIESIRSELEERGHRGGFFEDKVGIYREAVLLSLELDRPELAFGLAVRAKTRELAEAIGQRHNLASTAAAPLDPAVVAASLAHDEVLVELLLVDDQLIRFELRAGSPMVVHRERTPAIRSAARDFRAGIVADAAMSHLDGLARQLGDQLLGGIELAGVTTLIVAPDGPLAEIPFDLLPGEGAGGAGAQKEPRLLGERVVLRFLPSAAAFRREPRRAGLSSWTLLGVADPEPSTTFALGALPAARAEVASAAKHLGAASRTLFGPDATATAVLEAAAAGAAVLHVATHTLTDAPGGQTGIVLSPSDGYPDGLLRPRDLADINLDLELTVLAACSTGRGDGGSTGLGNLTGALLAAGSRAVIASLWDVDDAATAVLMDQLYWELGRGTSPPLALARAKARLRGDSRWSDPRLWAGFVLVGDAGPVVEGRGRRGPVEVGLGLVVLVLVGLAVRRWSTRESGEGVRDRQESTRREKR